jgi:hypothetical protein
MNFGEKSSESTPTVNAIYSHERGTAGVLLNEAS